MSRSVIFPIDDSTIIAPEAEGRKSLVKWNSFVQPNRSHRTAQGSFRRGPRQHLAVLRVMPRKLQCSVLLISAQNRTSHPASVPRGATSQRDVSSSIQHRVDYTREDGHSDKSTHLSLWMGLVVFPNPFGQ